MVYKTADGDMGMLAEPKKGKFFFVKFPIDAGKYHGIMDAKSYSEMVSKVLNDIIGKMKDQRKFFIEENLKGITDIAAFERFKKEAMEYADRDIYLSDIECSISEKDKSALCFLNVSARDYRFEDSVKRAVPNSQVFEVTVPEKFICEARGCYDSKKAYSVNFLR